MNNQASNHQLKNIQMENLPAKQVQWNQKVNHQNFQPEYEKPMNNAQINKNVGNELQKYFYNQPNQQNNPYYPPPYPNNVQGIVNRPNQIPLGQPINQPNFGVYAQPPPPYYSPQQVIVLENHTYDHNYCPNCRRITPSGIQFTPGATAWIICIVLFILGCWLCCFIPFCIDDCKIRDYRCTACNYLKRRVGT